MYRQSIPELGLSIERGTPAVADDGKFHVLLNGEEVFASAKEKEAVEEYRRLKAALGVQSGRKKSIDVKAALQREIADRQVTSFLAESAQQKRAKALRKGGKGGSGGVGR
ncbi:MAG: hypothetical protein C4575_00745 [Desulforudis sp.]|jgi:hypothetical protein|nr:MAG: hypothetical protein C4575_00745 [Desulforudis sp.]